jgi:hypothetical protein
MIDALTYAATCRRRAEARLWVADRTLAIRCAQLARQAPAQLDAAGQVLAGLGTAAAGAADALDDLAVELLWADA